MHFDHLAKPNVLDKPNVPENKKIFTKLGSFAQILKISPKILLNATDDKNNDSTPLFKILVLIDKPVHSML